VKPLRIACDIGGTFTDILVFNQETGEVSMTKVPSTPEDPHEAIINGLNKMGLSMREVDFFGHGSTVALNTLIQRKGARTGLITTEGFRDILEIQRFNRPDMYNLFYRKPVPLVPRYLRLEVDERVMFDGKVSEDIDLEELDQRIRELLSEGIEALAICFINSYINPINEEKALDHVRRNYPDLYSQASYRLTREWREYERTSTVAMSSYLMPSVRNYLRRLRLNLEDMGHEGDVLITKSDGGLMTVEMAEERPVSMLMSGPAGGVLGAQYFSRLTDNPNVITLDMGGTSTDVCLVDDGEPKLEGHQEIERYPVLEPSIDIYSIGAGGGTIAWVDDTGMLKMGPHSAGANPGPACYGMGGTEPTVTDANLLLGRLNPDYFLAGEMKLDVEAARRAFKGLADRLGMGLQECACGAVRIVNAAMTAAIRSVSIEKGYDPRDFHLLVFGGAGALHGSVLAQELSIPRVIIPRNPSHMSPWGILVADIKYNYSRTHIVELDKIDLDAVNAIFTELKAEGESALAKGDAAGKEMEFLCSLDMRYAGQEHTVSVVCDAPLDRAGLQRVRADFDRLHEQFYAFSMPAEECEIVTIRVDALGHIRGPEMQQVARGSADSTAALRGNRPVYFEQVSDFLDCPIYDRDLLRAGNTLDGPAVVEEPTSTVLVMPGQTLSVDGYGNLIIEV